MFSVFTNKNTENQNFKNKVTKLLKTYGKNIDHEHFMDEMKQFLWIEKEDLSRKGRYFFIHDGLRSTYPNIETILKIILTIPVSIASAERPFSVLKRVKNYLRSNLSQSKTNDFSLLCIESKVLNSIDYKGIDQFAKTKSRKKHF